LDVTGPASERISRNCLPKHIIRWLL
jgi:hypothetical protein